MISFIKLFPFICSPLVIYIYQLNGVRLDWLDVSYGDLYQYSLLIVFFSCVAFLLFYNLEKKILRGFFFEDDKKLHQSFIFYLIIGSLLSRYFDYLDFRVLITENVSSIFYDYFSLAATFVFINQGYLIRKNKILGLLLIFLSLIFLSNSGSKGTLVALILVYILLYPTRRYLIISVISIVIVSVSLFYSSHYLDRYMNIGISSTYYYLISDLSGLELVDFFQYLLLIKFSEGHAISNDIPYIYVVEYLKSAGFAVGYNLTPSAFFIDSYLGFFLYITYLYLVFIIVRKPLFPTRNNMVYIFFISLSLLSSTIFDAFKYLFMALSIVVLFRLSFVKFKLGLH